MNEWNLLRHLHTYYRNWASRVRAYGERWLRVWPVHAHSVSMHADTCRHATVSLHNASICLSVCRSCAPTRSRHTENCPWLMASSRSTRFLNRGVTRVRSGWVRSSIRESLLWLRRVVFFAFCHGVENRGQYVDRRVINLDYWKF